MSERLARTSSIGTLNENPLHAALKSCYAEPGDEFEVSVDGYVIDIVRAELLIEIQTSNFSGIRYKLRDLVAGHPLRLVYPIPREKWIVKLTPDGATPTSRRKSPKRGSIEDVFLELVSIPDLLHEERFSVEVVLIKEEEVRRHEENRGWRRGGWVTKERRLLEILSMHRFDTPADLTAVVSHDLPDQFTTADMALALGRPRRLAQKMAYCLREMGEIVQVGKQGRAPLYERAK